MTIEEKKDLASDYARLIAAEVEALEVVLSSDWDEVSACEECGEAESWCRSLYGSDAGATCLGCGAITDAEEVGQECPSGCESADGVPAVYVPNEAVHDYRPSLEAARDLWRNMAEEVGEGHRIEGYAPSVIDYINAQCLEFKTLGEKSGGGSWSVTGVDVLRTFGGPNCWIEWRDGQSSVVVHVFWGGDERSQRVHAPAVAGALEELADLELADLD